WSNTFGRGVYHLVLAILQYIETFNPEVSFTGTINNVKIDSTSLLNDLFATLVKEAKKFNRITVSVEYFKEIIAIFAANISDFLSSLSEFVDDLINVINACWWVTAGTESNDIMYDTMIVVIVVIPGDDFVGIAYDYDLESQYKNDDLEQCQIQFL
ncbi:16092_t:CDS:2, partial [Rhizophagus irregularis]